MARIPATIGDFSVLPVRMPVLAALGPGAAPVTHYIYVRPSAPKIPTADDERSLFLANVPADSTTAHLRALFASLVGPGRFESITFEDERRQRIAAAGGLDSKTAALPGQAVRLATLQSRKRKREAGGRPDDSDDDASVTEEEQRARLPSTWTHHLRRSGSTATVLLVDARSVTAVLKAVAKTHGRTDRAPAWPLNNTLDHTDRCGPAWLAAHNRAVYPDRVAVREAVDVFFSLYNTREAEAAEAAKWLRNEPDADGFVTVMGGGGGGNPARRAEAEAARDRQEAKAAKKAAELTNFYRFQLREFKKEEQAELQRRFQEDRRRVAVMREKRGKFRPEA